MISAGEGRVSRPCPGSHQARVAGTALCRSEVEAPFWVAGVEARLSINKYGPALLEEIMRSENCGEPPRIGDRSL